MLRVFTKQKAKQKYFFPHPLHKPSKRYPSLNNRIFSLQKIKSVIITQRDGFVESVTQRDRKNLTSAN